MLIINLVVIYSLFNTESPKTQTRIQVFNSSDSKYKANSGYTILRTQIKRDYGVMLPSVKDSCDGSPYFSYHGVAKDCVDVVTITNSCGSLCADPIYDDVKLSLEQRRSIWVDYEIRTLLKI